MVLIDHLPTRTKVEVGVAVMIATESLLVEEAEAGVVVVVHLPLMTAEAGAPVDHQADHQAEVEAVIDLEGLFEALIRSPPALPLQL